MIFDFIDRTLECDQYYYAFDEYDYLCNQIAQDDTRLTIVDHGAGSVSMRSSKRTVKQILQSNVSKGRKAELLFKIALWQKPKRVLELGTSLGLSAWLLSKIGDNHQIVTVEGDSAVAEYAHHVLKDVNQVTLVNDRFESAVASLTDEKFDIIYLDGHHDGTATIRYIEMLKSHLAGDGMIIIDDIYWSSDMHQAWQMISRDEFFSVCIDLYQFGILMNRSGQYEKEHFTLASKALKPWHLGIWG